MVPNSNQLERDLLMSGIASMQLEQTKFERLLYFLEHPRDNDISEDHIEIAKNYPVESLLPNPVKRHMTNCFNHEDKHPSMKVNDTWVHCFVCNRAWDSISVVRHLLGLNFVEAVKYLATK